MSYKPVIGRITLHSVSVDLHGNSANVAFGDIDEALEFLYENKERFRHAKIMYTKRLDEWRAERIFTPFTDFDSLIYELT